MPEKTITEEVTETKEHTIRVCDSCMVREYDSERGGYIRRDGVRVDICSACLDDLQEAATGQPVEVLRKREWLESDCYNDTVEDKLKRLAIGTVPLFAIAFLAPIAAGGAWGLLAPVSLLLEVGCLCIIDDLYYGVDV